jgi:hypothetical protein
MRGSPAAVESGWQLLGRAQTGRRRSPIHVFVSLHRVGPGHACCIVLASPSQTPRTRPAAHSSLHLRSGVPRAQLAELHGNCFAERCRRCGSEYIRDFEMDTVGGGGFLVPRPNV